MKKRHLLFLTGILLTSTLFSGCSNVFQSHTDYTEEELWNNFVSYIETETYQTDITEHNTVTINEEGVTLVFTNDFSGQCESDQGNQHTSVNIKQNMKTETLDITKTDYVETYQQDFDTYVKTKNSVVWTEGFCLRTDTSIESKLKNVSANKTDTGYVYEAELTLDDFNDWLDDYAAYYYCDEQMIPFYRTFSFSQEINGSNSYSEYENNKTEFGSLPVFLTITFDNHGQPEEMTIQNTISGYFPFGEIFTRMGYREYRDEYVQIFGDSYKANTESEVSMTFTFQPSKQKVEIPEEVTEQASKDIITDGNWTWGGQIPVK